MDTVGKLIVKKNVTAIKKGIGCMGKDSDGEFIFVNLKSRSALDATFNKIMAQIKQEYKLPMREKTLRDLSEIERDIYNIRTEEDMKNKLILCYKTEDPAYKETENEIKKMELVAHMVSFLDMDAIVADAEGNDITQWEWFGISAGNYLSLCKHIISEDGMYLSEDSINLLSSEIMRVNNSEKTKGEIFLEAIDKQNAELDIINELEADVNEPNESE